MVRVHLAVRISLITSNMNAIEEKFLYHHEAQ